MPESKAHQLARGWPVTRPNQFQHDYEETGAGYRKPVRSDLGLDSCIRIQDCFLLAGQFWGSQWLLGSCVVKGVCL
jgi:hypothetical protein